MFDFARGGDDTFTFVSPSNTAYGDAGGDVSGHARGGNDTFTGGSSFGPGPTSNILFGDAKSMFDCANGGDDTLTAGSCFGSRQLFLLGSLVERAFDSPIHRYGRLPVARSQQDFNGGFHVVDSVFP
ncbi:hypothetical protein ABIG06_005058 [Bradyrhizobium sp. USDA 326]|uniref:hypothetical protein n=1 Tax=unclassified Bradyrhizobium TaxID=2631580 RepID=UPI003512B56F